MSLLFHNDRVKIAEFIDNSIFISPVPVSFLFHLVSNLLISCTFWSTPLLFMYAVNMLMRSMYRREAIYTCLLLLWLHP